MTDRHQAEVPEELKIYTGRIVRDLSGKRTPYRGYIAASSLDEIVRPLGVALTFARNHWSETQTANAEFLRANPRIVFLCVYGGRLVRDTYQAEAEARFDARETDGKQEFLFEVHGCYEPSIGAALDAMGGDLEETETVTVWSVRPPTDHIMGAEGIVDTVMDSVFEEGEITEEVHGCWSAASEDPKVTAAAENLRRVLASQVKSRMADEQIGTVTGTPAELRAIVYPYEA